jgi:hypothetical protein
METLKKIALIAGNKTEIEKEIILMKMLSDGQGSEIKYIVRWI